MKERHNPFFVRGWSAELKDAAQDGAQEARGVDDDDFHSDYLILSGYGRVGLSDSV